MSLINDFLVELKISKIEIKRLRYKTYLEEKYNEIVSELKKLLDIQEKTT